MKDSQESQDFSVLKEGVRFECQGSGKCCLSRGQFGYVYLTLSDRRKMARLLEIPTTRFTKDYCEKSADGLFFLKSEDEKAECIFLENNKCEVYHARPTQCRTWPFWPEMLNAKSWKNEVISFCPGIERGRYYSPKEVSEIADQQERSESEL